MPHLGADDLRKIVEAMEMARHIIYCHNGPSSPTVSRLDDAISLARAAGKEDVARSLLASAVSALDPSHDPLRAKINAYLEGSK